MIDPKQLALLLVQRNPNVANSPQAQEMLQIIQNGNQDKGSEIAENLCRTMGVSKETALAQAKQFFGIR